MAINKAQIERVVSLAKSYGATRIVLFGSAIENPEEARDLDLALDGISGWKLYELGARLEDELNVSLDIVSLSPATHFTHLIESKGKELL
jgi:predicted nucleotidyltransferase